MSKSLAKKPAAKKPAPRSSKIEAPFATAALKLTVEEREREYEARSKRIAVALEVLEHVAMSAPVQDVLKKQLAELRDALGKDDLFLALQWVERDHWVLYQVQKGVAKDEAGARGNRAKRQAAAKKRAIRIELVAKLYHSYRTQHPRARVTDVITYIGDELESKGTRPSDYQIESRDLRDLRASGRIPKYHTIPYVPTSKAPPLD